MEVQIFGVKNDSGTRKAVRFFAERRIKAHFVDLKQRPAAKGELRRFVQKFGVPALVDSEAKRYAALGLHAARRSDDWWLELLATEPMIIRIPLVRFQQLFGKLDSKSIYHLSFDWSGKVNC